MPALAGAGPLAYGSVIAGLHSPLTAGRTTIQGDPAPRMARAAPSHQLDTVFVAGFVATPGRASEADGEALGHAVVRSLVDAGYAALYGGMEPCVRARQQAALRGIGIVVCGRLLLTTPTHHEVEWMMVAPGSEFGPAHLREESLERLAGQVRDRVLRERPPVTPWQGPPRRWTGSGWGDSPSHPVHPGTIL